MYKRQLIIELLQDKIIGKSVQSQNIEELRDIISQLEEHPAKTRAVVKEGTPKNVLDVAR